MASMANDRKFKFFFFSLLFFPLSFRALTSILLPLRTRRTTVHHLVTVFPEKASSNPSIENPTYTQRNGSLLFDFLAKEFYGKKIKIGLVNLNEGEEEEWKSLGEANSILFDRVPEDRQWEDFFPEWIDEERWPPPTCPEIPMPRSIEYREFDVVVSRVPCGNGVDRKGVRDLFRLQVNLVVANLVISGLQLSDNHRPVYVVFIGSCGPMWEIFRCDDLLRHEGDVWIYRPDLRRLKQKVLMPAGTCQLALPYAKQGDGEIKYDFAKLGNPIDHPREAYVTVLHSSDDYVCGAIALAQSIIQTNSTKHRVLLADEYITKKSRQALEAAGWKVKLIDRIRNPNVERGTVNEWNYSKLRVWQLTEYDKIIFIDSDLIILKNIDNFFASPQLSAAGNDKVIFNSGVMLIEPSECMFEILMRKRRTIFSYNGGDQGLLNEVFTWWHRWPKKINYLKYFKGNGTKRELPESLYALHCVGWKPWMCYRDYDCNWDSLDQKPFVFDSAHRRWWQVYDTIPEGLRKYCALSESMDSRLKEQRNLAKNARLPNGHWKIKVKDPRQHQ